MKQDGLHLTQIHYTDRGYFSSSYSRFGEFVSFLQEIGCPENPRLRNTVSMYSIEFTKTVEIDNKTYMIEFNQSYKQVGMKPFYTIEFRITRILMFVNRTIEIAYETHDFIELIKKNNKNKILWQ